MPAPQLELSMASLVETYDYCMTHLADPRTKGWLLVGSPLPTVFLVILYLLTVHYGQRFMAHRAPFDLKEIMVVYNVCVVLLNFYMVYELVVTSWLAPGFNLECALVDTTSDNNLSQRLADVIWWYYISKLIEFADTVFFVLRKKNNQVTFLHLYHHASMPLLWWLGTRFGPGGEAFFSSTLNSFVHVVMYSYYLLAAMGPRVQRYLWWKKYLTGLQMFQFVLVLAKVSYTVATDCQYPRLFQKMLLFYVLSLLAFFSNFCYHTYVLRKPSSRRAKAKVEVEVNGKVEGKAE